MIKIFNKILFIFFTLLKFLNSQNLEYPNQCNETQYFDINELSCKSCPINSKKSDNYNCKCNQEYYFTLNNGGSSIACKKCDNNLIQSLDGFECVKNIISTSLCSFESEFSLNGTRYKETNLNKKECIVCNDQETTSSGQACISCKPFIYAQLNETFIKDLKCKYNNDQLKGGIIFPDGEYKDDPTRFDAPFEKDLKSWYINEYLVSFYRQSKIDYRRNQTSYQSLFNMCVLNLYDNGYNDACTYFDKIKITDSQTTSNSENVIIQYNDNCQVNGKLNYLAAEYSLRGNLIDFKEFDMSKLQICSLVSPYLNSLDNDYLFSTKSFYQTCSISIKKLLETFNKETVFYQLYLRYNISKIQPVSVSINNKDYQRFFLVDTISSKSNANDVKPKYIRYAKSITLSYNLVENSIDGMIYPPKLLINYDFTNTDNINKTIEIEFKIQYEMDLKIQLRNFYIAIGIFGGLGFIWSILKVANWNKRAGKYAIDFLTIFKFLMFLVNSIGNLFSIVFVSTCIYWLIFYRAQKVAFLFLPLENQETIFTIFITLSAALKLIDVFYIIFVQTSFNLFLIDWEKPKHGDKSYSNEIVNTSRFINTNTKTKRNENKIQENDINKLNQLSCWRTIFVANEWNEIQVFRKINLTVQIMLVLFLLKVINLENLAVRDCSFSLESNQIQADYSRLLRVGIASSLFLAIG